MPRPLVVGNGNLLVTFDGDLSIRDLYWPYVGLHNHLSGHRARIGLWVDGRFAWLSDRAWERNLRFEPNTLVTNAECRHAEWGIRLIVNDCVTHREDILLRRFRIDNEWATPREVRLFLAHDFHIAETDIGDTAFYNPFLDAVIHYKRDTYLLIGATSSSAGIYQYATGIKGFQGAEGTWRDAEDGELSMNPVAQGSVDSVLSVKTSIAPHRTSEMRSWLCAARNLDAVERLHRRVTDQGFDTLVHDTAHYWTAWSDVERDRMADLPDPIPDLVRRSLLILRTNIDNRGAIIAANDSDIMETARAHYSYMWPRDGAVVASVLDRLGYQDITRRFFQFCAGLLPRQRAVLLHKYSADGSWGATWHPWTVEGHSEIPFQEDSTALVIWALARHYERYHDIEFLEELYEPFARPCADFIAAYRDPITKLPLPSYDLWEERRGVHAYTCGTVYGALMAASRLSDVFDDGRSDAYREAAGEVREGMAQHLWDEKTQRFARRLILHEPGAYERDLVIDSALHAVHQYGAFSPDDPRVMSTMRTVLSRLWVQTSVGGIARYENDYYFRRVDNTQRVAGNPWPVCTLWQAQWFIGRAHTHADLATAMELLQWAARNAMSTGVMAEQIHPETGEPLSVAPLTWSHAEFVSTVLDYLDRRDRLNEAP